MASVYDDPNGERCMSRVVSASANYSQGELRGDEMHYMNEDETAMVHMDRRQYGRQVVKSATSHRPMVNGGVHRGTFYQGGIQQSRRAQVYLGHRNNDKMNFDSYEPLAGKLK